MNQDFPLFSLTQPQTAKRRSAKSQFFPLPPEKIEQRQEKANNLR